MQPRPGGYERIELRRRAMPYKLAVGSVAQRREPVPQSFGFAVRRGALATGAALVIAVAGAAAAQAAIGPYVSLGDSYTAAPLVPNPTGSPILCGRSTSNYPSDVTRVLSPSSFTDASCSSATTADMTTSQSLEGGQQ